MCFCSLPIAPEDHTPIKEMGDHHQVKTSFLFIQLQSPSRAQQCQPSAESLSLGTQEDVSSDATAVDTAQPSVEDLESIYTGEEESTTVYKDALNDSVDSKPIPEEAHSPVFAAGITEKKSYSSDSTRTDIRSSNQETTPSSSCECSAGNESQECLNCELNKSLNSVFEKDSSGVCEESSICLLYQEPPENMNKVVQSSSLGNFCNGPRVSILYPSKESDCQNLTTPHNTDLSPTPSGVPPACAPASTSPSTHRLSHSSWVQSAKHKEEAAAQEKTQTVQSTNPDRTTFVSTVIKRSSMLYGDACKPARNSFVVTSDVDKSSENHSLALVGTGKLTQAALTAEPLHTETPPSTMLQSTAPEKVRVP